MLKVFWCKYRGGGRGLGEDVTCDSDVVRVVNVCSVTKLVTDDDES